MNLKPLIKKAYAQREKDLTYSYKNKQQAIRDRFITFGLPKKEVNKQIPLNKEGSTFKSNDGIILTLGPLASLSQQKTVFLTVSCSVCQKEQKIVVWNLSDIYVSLREPTICHNCKRKNWEETNEKKSFNIIGTIKKIFTV